MAKKTNNNYDDLEDQIGNLGDIQIPSDNEITETKPTTNLGELRNKDLITGQKRQLSDQEEADLEAFKNRGRNLRESRSLENNISDGWVLVNRDEMGIRSEFYPGEWDFYIKPAKVSAIKNWVGVDEENTTAVNKVLNEIIRTSVKIDTNGVGQGGWGQINSWDRFWFILKVREVTFAIGESKIEFSDQCSSCDQDLQYTLYSGALHYEYPDDSLIEKYWDGYNWNIDPEEYGVNHDPIILYTPKLGRDEKIVEWATGQARAKKTIDENFVKFLMWMLPNPSKDINILNRQIDKIYSEYKSWSIEMFEFMDDVIRNLTINPSESLRIDCINCGEEAISNVRFPDGIKILFRTQAPAKRFGTR